jgi:hypothetical protein
MESPKPGLRLQGEQEGRQRDLALSCSVLLLCIPAGPPHLLDTRVCRQDLGSHWGAVLTGRQKRKGDCVTQGPAWEKCGRREVVKKLELVTTLSGTQQRLCPGLVRPARLSFTPALGA